VLGVLGVDLSILLLVRAEELAVPGYAGASPATLLAVVLFALPLLWRRRAPLAVLGATALTGLVGVGLAVPSQNMAFLVALYTVAARRERRLSLAALAAAAIGIGLLSLVVEAVGPLPVQVIVLSTAWLLGDAQRAREAHTAALAERTRALLAEREQAAHLAAIEERARIARELHDVVAHSLGSWSSRRARPAAPTSATPRPRRPPPARSSRPGGQPRRLRGLGAPPAGGGRSRLRPAAGPRRAAGAARAASGTRPLHVALRVEGVPRPLPPGVDLSAYRIVQESLTNVLKHADATSAVVTLAGSRRR
jgi:signal transduction histidine kinase